jgi:bacillopeptidase F (M6 metalloprotease family)
MSYRGSDAAVARAMVAQYGGGKRWFAGRDCHYGGVSVGTTYTPVSSDLRGNITFMTQNHKNGQPGTTTLQSTYLGNQLEGWYDAELCLRDHYGGLIDICLEELRAELTMDKEKQKVAREKREEEIVRHKLKKERAALAKKKAYDKRELELLESGELLKDKTVKEVLPSTGYENNQAFGSW